MKLTKNKGKFALTVFVLLLTIAITINGYGYFSYKGTPPSKDAYGIFVRFVGDDPPSTPTATNCSVSPTSVALGNNLTVSGYVISTLLTPVSGVTVILTYTKPDATTLTRTVTTGTDGSFNDVYNPGVAGSWSVKANWLGNANHLGSTSFAVAFTVTTPGAGVPMEYVLAAAAVIIIVIVAIVAYWYTKKK
jgi:hypothetical protein